MAGGHALNQKGRNQTSICPLVTSQIALETWNCSNLNPTGADKGQTLWLPCGSTDEAKLPK